MKSTYYEIHEGRMALIDCCTISGVVMVTRINTPPPLRQRGIATRLLRQCCADADAEGEVLELYVSPSGEMGSEDLAAWYTAHGFTAKPGGGHPHHMQRAPSKKDSPERS